MLQSSSLPPVHVVVDVTAMTSTKTYQIFIFDSAALPRRDVAFFALLHLRRDVVPSSLTASNRLSFSRSSFKSSLFKFKSSNLVTFLVPSSASLSSTLHSSRVKIACIHTLSAVLTGLLGGSADLASSNKTLMKMSGNLITKGHSCCFNWSQH
ncbi:hypothetical protein PIB30_054868 [Stylosanthes scabra]|uniref:Uncharacterized protein n=1 Tax=Stylosanthes scabra TaxID=79078 RepID=A0ABU6WJE6_9FABA|nr:hypothetical protein [Stylosanthes scabra]